MASIFTGPGVNRGAGALIFLTTGWCINMVGIRSALSLVLSLLVLANWSASKFACTVMWVYFPHTTTQICHKHTILVKCTVYKVTLYTKVTLYSKTCWWSWLIKFHDLRLKNWLTDDNLIIKDLIQDIYEMEKNNYNYTLSLHVCAQPRK